MEQVFINVCKNSLEAIDDDGTITVRLVLERGRPCALLSVPVSDDGTLFAYLRDESLEGRDVGDVLVTVLDEPPEQAAHRIANRAATRVSSRRGACRMGVV